MIQDFLEGVNENHMKIRRIIWFLIFFAIVSTPLFYYISENVWIIQTRLMNTNINGKMNKDSKKIYDLNVPLENHMITRMKTYKIISREITKDTVKMYAKKLDLSNNVIETSSLFSVKNQKNQLTVNKNTGLIQYKSLKNKNEKINKEITSQQALNKVIDFIKHLQLSCNHQKSLVEDIPMKNRYQVRFINSLEGIPNYGYCTKAEISYKGEILNLECHQVTYKPRQIVAIKSTKEAYNELIKVPIDGEDIQVDIQKIELVYLLRKSNESQSSELILQPAYRFFGEIAEDSSFEYFISAIDD